MNDMQPFPCCDQNKDAKAIVYRDYKRRQTGKGYYMHCFQSPGSNKWVLASFCPFCGKDIKRLACLL